MIFSRLHTHVTHASLYISRSPLSGLAAELVSPLNICLHPAPFAEQITQAASGLKQVDFMTMWVNIEEAHVRRALHQIILRSFGSLIWVIAIGMILAWLGHPAEAMLGILLSIPLTMLFGTIYSLLFSPAYGVAAAVGGGIASGLGAMLSGSVMVGLEAGLLGSITFAAVLTPLHGKEIAFLAAFIGGISASILANLMPVLVLSLSLSFVVGGSFGLLFGFLLGAEFSLFTWDLRYVLHIAIGGALYGIGVAASLALTFITLQVIATGLSLDIPFGIGVGVICLLVVAPTSLIHPSNRKSGRKLQWRAKRVRINL